jgi:hypothetical protein
VLAGCGNSSDDSASRTTVSERASTTTVPPNAPIMTVAEFNRIKMGMTYKQVVAIVGGPAGGRTRNGAHDVVASWNGNYGSAWVEFRNGVAVGKSQARL